MMTTNHDDYEPSDGAHLVDLGPLGLDRGGHLLIERSLAALAPGERLRVIGTDPSLEVHVAAWARQLGHRVERHPSLVLIRGDTNERRWADGERAGVSAAVSDQAPATWGLAARGALVESGGPQLPGVDLDRKDMVWTDLAPMLYAQAAANQWDPATAVDWTPPSLAAEIEAAVVQTMTYLVENEQTALLVSARFLGRVHPHYREISGFLATQAADEARHVEVFSRRAGLCGQPVGISGAGGRASLQSLLDEPDWANASFLLSTLGEGTFLSLLSFLETYAPDPVTARITHLALADEARHVAFSLAHLGEHVTTRPEHRDQLRAALERRYHALASTSGLAPAVHDSLVLLAARSWEPHAIRAGWDAVQSLQADMEEGRRRRLVRLGFTEGEATELARLHTRNFM
jgi:hypothetical protein